jgi:hypothetical protein
VKKNTTHQYCIPASSLFSIVLAMVESWPF